MNIARAYVYSGQWVADCPAECGNVELLRPKAGIFHCSYCRVATTNIEWPSDADEIMAVLDLRPVPHTRNWYPKDHATAVKFRIEHGQSIDDLRQENADHGVQVK